MYAVGLKLKCLHISFGDKIFLPEGFYKHGGAEQQCKQVIKVDMFSLC